MKHAKLIGLAALATLTIMAVVGASSASATGLCKVSQSPCAAGNAYASGQTYTATSKSAVFSNEVENVTCNESSMTLKQVSPNNGAGASLPGEITALTMSKCTSTLGFSCEVKTRNLPYFASLNLTIAPNGTLIISPLGTRTPGFSVSCAGGFLKCVFSSSEMKLQVLGGSPAAIEVKGVPLVPVKTEGFVECPKFPSWTAKYTATSPTAVFVSAS